MSMPYYDQSWALRYIGTVLRYPWLLQRSRGAGVARSALRARALDALGIGGVLWCIARTKLSDAPRHPIRANLPVGRGTLFMPALVGSAINTGRLARIPGPRS